MINKIAVICPTYGRPNTFNQIYENWVENNAGQSDFWFVFEESEAELKNKTNALYKVSPSGERGMVRPLNFAAVELAETYTYLMFVGDDHRFRTHDWDKQFIEAFEGIGKTGYVYCPEGYHNENLATACAMSSNIVMALGYMALPKQKHLFVDVYWMRMMERLGRKYLPDVFIEHMHPNFGKGAYDANYAAVNSLDVGANDETVYNEWLAYDIDKDIEKVLTYIKKIDAGGAQY